MAKRKNKIKAIVKKIYVHPPKIEMDYEKKLKPEIEQLHQQKADINKSFEGKKGFFNSLKKFAAVGSVNREINQRRRIINAEKKLMEADVIERLAKKRTSIETEAQKIAELKKKRAAAGVTFDSLSGAKPGVKQISTKDIFGY
jgi:Tfp pilus assembly protein PilN